MGRVICIKPCPPTTLLPSIHLPFMSGAMMAQGSFSLQGGCDGCELVGNLMLQLQPFLGAMGIPLCALGCLGAVIAFANSIPDALGPPPDPSKITTALANIAIKCACILQLALPPPAGAVCDFLKMIRDVVKTLDLVVSCIVGLVNHLLSLSLKATLKIGDPVQEISLAGQCLAAQVQTLMDALTGKFGAITTLLGAIQPILDLLASVPGISSVVANLKAGFAVFSGHVTIGTPPGAVLSALNDLKSALDVAVTAFNTAAAICP